MAPARISPAPNSSEVTQPKTLRRPTLVRKFAEANLDEVKDLQTPASPIKRAKVAFNNEVEINLVEEWHKAPELVREEVRRALERHRDSDNTQYDKLKQMFTINEDSGEIVDTATLRRYTSALLSNITLVDRSCSDLINLVLRSDWLKRDDTYVQLFQKLLDNLLLSQGSWLNPVLHVLVDNFVQGPGFARTSDRLPPVSPRQIRSRVHNTLQSILRLIPTGSSSLAHILSSRFPHIHDSKRTHVRYVHNLLHIVEYAPELQSEISSLIVDRIVKIDVQVQVDIEDLADDVGEDILQAIPKSTEDYMDESDDESGDESDLDSDAEDADPKVRAEEIASNIEKLDLLLDIMFNYYTRLFENPATQEIAFENLIAQFDFTILPTYQSRHTQFLLFHFAQSSPRLIDIFTATLWLTATDKIKAPLIRQTAASYLASFVARGQHVPTSLVRDVFAHISEELERLRKQHILDYRGPDPHRYGTYYALCQALFYIFCFRWRDLLVSAEDDITPSPSSMLYTTEDSDEMLERPTFLPEVKEALELHCFKGLNPLKVCAPTIVMEFARITYHLKILYIYSHLETNKRVRIINNAPQDHRETALSRSRGDKWQGLDAYFPFDPYKLPRSKGWLDGDYREWQPIPGLDDQEQEGESESEANEETDDEDDSDTATDGEEGKTD